MRLQTETTKAAKIVLIAGIVLILAVAGIYLFWSDAPPSPSPQASAPAETAATSEAPPVPAFVETSASAPIAAQGDYLNSPADLRQLTEKQSQLELKKLEVAVAEQEARLKELGASSNSSVPPQIVAMPGVAASMELGVPQGQPAPRERVISIQGLGGRIMATVETPEGLQTITVGDSLGYGQVERISIAGVEIRDGDQTRLIAVEE